MDKPLKLLMVEDSSRDVALEVRALEAAGYRVTYTVADTAAEMKAALAKQDFDLVISDHGLPQFDAPGALEVLKQSGLDIPFIIVSGTIGEEIAVALIKAGAHDYVMKDRLSRLASAVEQALQYAKERRAHIRAEDALRESETKFRNVFDNSAFGKSITFLDGTINANQALADMLGYTKEELSHLKWKEVTHPGDIDDNNRMLDLLQTGREKAIRFVKRYVKKDGTIIWVDGNTVLQRDSDGRPLYYITGIVDITESRRTGDALKTSEAQYRLLSEHTTDTVWLMDMNLNFIYHSPSVIKLRGFTAQEIMELPLEKQVTPASFELVTEVVFSEIPRIEADPDYNPVLTLDLEYTCKDGTTVWTENKFSIIRDENNKIVSILGEARDIMERKRAERIMEKQREEYRTIFDSVRPMIAYLDKEGVILRINRSGANAFGRDPKEIVGKTMYDFFPSAEADRFTADDRQVITSGKPVIGSISEYTLPSGQKKWAQIDRIPYFEEHGDVIGVITFNQDITQRKLSEEKLLKSYESLKKSLSDAINTMVKIVEIRDPYTAGHQQRVAELATAIATEMKLEDTRIDQLRTAAVIHDIGKMYVPADILSKPGRLSDMEFSLIKTHAQAGYDIVKDMDLPCNIAKTVLQHHERLDGSGYPNELKSEDTLLEAKILAAADVVEAMASHRPYRPALGIAKALEEISRNRGRLYDPNVVDACIKLFSSGKFEFKTV